MQEMKEMQVQSLGQGDLEESMTTHSSTLALRIPWTEEPGRLQSTGSQSPILIIVRKLKTKFCIYF